MPKGEASSTTTSLSSGERAEDEDEMPRAEERVTGRRTLLADGETLVFPSPARPP